MIIYRKANPDDIRPALALWFKVWDEFIVSEKPTENRDYNEITQNSGLLKKYESGERFMIIAVDDEKIIGVVGADIGSSSIKPPLCIDSEYHRQGIATELLHRMACELKIAGCDLIKVHSSKYALPFYERFGFIQTGAEQPLDGFDSIVSIPMEYTPNEIWDVLDADGNKKGRFHERGRPMATGDYHVIVHVWKRNSKREWLIDKRAPRYGIESLDGKWETTGGAAVAGDDSLTAALRETKEELGIELDPEKGTLFNRFARLGSNGHTWFEDVWIFEYDEPIESVAYDGREVCEAMWATADKIREMMDADEFLTNDDGAYPYFDEMMEKWG